MAVTRSAGFFCSTALNAATKDNTPRPRIRARRWCGSRCRRNCRSRRRCRRRLRSGGWCRRWCRRWCRCWCWCWCWCWCRCRCHSCKLGLEPAGGTVAIGQTFRLITGVTDRILLCVFAVALTAQITTRNHLDVPFFCTDGASCISIQTTLTSRVRVKG